jgi:sulfur-carrier protein adenylyltransferase/sulfurtransferase
MPAPPLVPAPDTDCSPAEARARQRQGVPLIDVRAPAETAEGLPAGAQALPLDSLVERLPARVADRSAPLLLICASGQRSQRAVERLQAEGYTAAVSVRGGYQRWLAEGLPVEIPDDAEARWRQRYARQLILPEVGEAGQRRLQAAHVLLVGAGGLGSPAALYLAGAGIGTLGLVDHDTVDRSNLHRQVLHTDARVGELKVASAQQTLSALNPSTQVIPHAERLSAENVDRLFAGYDLIVDGSDNFPTRYLVSDACVRLGKANVYAAVQGFEGQVAAFPAGGAPCYRCLFPEVPTAALAPTCNAVGVLGVIPGIVGLLQALAVLNLLLAFGESPLARLQLFDGRRGSLRSLRLRPDPACPQCGAAARAA